MSWSRGVDRNCRTLMMATDVQRCPCLRVFRGV